MHIYCVCYFSCSLIEGSILQFVHTNERANHVNDAMRIFTCLDFNEDADDEAWAGRVTPKRWTTLKKVVVGRGGSRDGKAEK